MCDAILTDPGLLHVVNVFIASDGALAERAIGDGLEKGIFLSGFDAGFDEVTHAQPIKLKMVGCASAAVGGECSKGNSIKHAQLAIGLSQTLAEAEGKVFQKFDFHAGLLSAEFFKILQA